MARLVLYMSMSLDGFIAGPGDNKDNPFGTRGHRLHKWLGDGGADVSGFRPSDEPSRTVFDEMISTGAVITGRRTGDFVDYWGGDHHDGVPIFVPTPRRAQLPHELRDGGTGLVGAVLLDEMDSADGQVGPRADEALGAGAARQPFRAPGETFRIADPKASTSAATPNPKDVKSGGVLVNRRLGSARREVLAMAAYDLAALWEAHCRYEFETRDVDATMSTMVAEPYVNHIPTMTGGVGFERLRHFYAHHFVGVNPPDFELVAVSRTVGESSLVDEFIVRFTHTTRMDWMLPGIEPTGRAVEIPTVAIVRFQEDKLVHEHIYWDQASVLVQLGLLDPDGLPIAGAETARKVLNASLPSNTLMNPSQ